VSVFAGEYHYRCQCNHPLFDVIVNILWHIAEDRAGLERLCRYVTRPPLAAGRLQLIDADLLTFRLKIPWSDGTTHRLLSCVGVD